MSSARLPGFRSLYKIGGSLAVILLLALFAARSARAQTPVAQFSYALQTLGGSVITPGGIAVDPHGNVFTATSGAVKAIPAGCTTSSCVVTIGGGFDNPFGVAVDGAGNVFVADTGDSAVKEIPVGCTSASCVETLGDGFNHPEGVAVDGAGNVFVADQGNNAVKEIPVGCTTASCVVTLGGGFTGPGGVAVDGVGDVFVADTGDSAVKEIPVGCTTASCVSTLGGGFSFPDDVAVDGAGNLFVADTGNNAVKEMPVGCTTAGCVETLDDNFNHPGGVAVDGSGNVFVADSGDDEVAELERHSVDFGTEPVGSTSAAQILTFTFNVSVKLGAPEALMMGVKNIGFAIANGGSCTSGASEASGDTCTVNATFTPNVAGEIHGAVNLTSSAGAVIATAYVHGIGQGPQAAFDADPTTGDASIEVGGGFNYPNGVAVDGSGNIFVADTNNSAVKEIPVGCTTASCVKTLGGGFSYPYGVAVDGAGNIFVADSGNSAVKEIPVGCTTASCVEALGGGFNHPAGMAADGSGNIFIGDTYNNAVKEIPVGCTTASCVKTLGGGFSNPGGVAVDGAGNVFVDDQSNNAVKEIPASCVAGANNSSCVKTLGGGLNDPFGVAADGAGNVFVADSDNNAVKEIPASCIAGANNASCVETLGGGFNSPGGVAVDGYGNVFVGDSSNNAVKTILRGAPPARSFASTNVGATSSPQAITVTNMGNEPLSFPIPTTAGDYNPSVAANFTYSDSSTCLQNGADAVTPFTLAAGAGCTVAIDFAPTAAGTISGNAVLTTNSLNTAAPDYLAQEIQLSGTGIQSVTQLAFVATVPSSLTAGGNAGTVTVAEQDSTGATIATATDSITLTVTGPNSYSATYTAAAVAGVATFNLSSDTLKTAGDYAYTATSGSYTQATANGTVTAAAASTIVAVSGGGLSTAINTAFPENLVVEVEDTYGNPVAGASVAFTAPTSGASATLSTPTTTASDGETYVTATANGTGGTYTVTASTVGVTSTAAFSLTNNKAAATVTLGDLAQTYTGSPLTATATTDPVGLAVSFTYNGSATAPTHAGSYTVVATINDPNHSGTATGTLVIAKATPVVSWAAPAPISYGTALSATQLDATTSFNGQAVDSTAVYTPATGTVLGVGTQTLSVQFTPTDTTDYNPVSATQNLSVEPATGTITTTPTAPALVYGQTLSASTLTGGSVSANGASVAGVFAWTNPATVPGAGTTSYPVTFTPTNTTDYSTMSTMVPVTVAQADSTVTAANATRVYGAANPAFTGSVTGLVNGDTAASVGLVYSTTATVSSAPGSYPITATITSSNYKLAVTPGTLTVTAPTLTVTAANATRVYGTANPAFTGSVTGQVNGDTFTESYTTTATVTSNVGSYAIVPSVTGANLANYTVKTTNGALTITQAATTTTLTASATSITPGQSLTLTAHVVDASKGSTGMPTGTVSIFDGTTQLGTATVANGAASFSTSTLASGTHAFTAAYSGDVNFQPSTSSTPASIPVGSLSFSLNLTSGQGSTVVPGSSADYTFKIAPTDGAYPGVVSFTVTGLPTGATAIFSPASIPVNGGAQTVTMTIRTPPATVAQNHKSNPFQRGSTVAIGFLLVPFLGLKKRKRWMKMLSILLLTVGMGAFTGLASGCGANGFFRQQQKSYQVTVTATSGAVSQSSVVTLNVE